ncbi:DUF4123 domain-containing protein [Pseudomonas sp. H11T01]|uniref:DUF4123 domain-containing protein n=1 Tax=Pseudomonas sp. H11T01 TaxID=3402749 RepID=UPI003ABE1532
MNLKTALPDDLPWAEHKAFLLVDGTAHSELSDRLATLHPHTTRFALYDCLRFRALNDISPLLVDIQEPDNPIFRFYLEHAFEEWGLLLFSSVPAYELVQHLRKLLTVELPTGQEVFLRLADAGVAQALFASADQRLFGPLSGVVIPDSVDGIWHRHQPRLPKCPELPAPYRLSPEQNAALDRVDRRRALRELDVHLLTYFPERHALQSLAQRWPRLERLLDEASSLGFSSQSDLFYYTNVMNWLGDSTLEQHPDIARLLHTPSLQSPSERVALAAELAHRFATQREPS